MSLANEGNWIPFAYITFAFSDFASFMFERTHHPLVCLNSSRMEAMTVLSRAESSWVPWELDAKLYQTVIQHTWLRAELHIWSVAVMKSITWFFFSIYSTGKPTLYIFLKYVLLSIFCLVNTNIRIYVHMWHHRMLADSTMHINIYLCAGHYMYT